MWEYRFDHYKKLKGLSFREIAKGSGVALHTVQRVQKNGNVSMATIDALMNYFGCEQLSDFVEWQPDQKEGEAA